MTHKKDVEKLFNDWARSGRAEGMEKRHFPRAISALNAMDFMRGSKLIDVGCGNGWATRWLRERTGANGYVAGIDLSPQMVASAQELSKGISNIEYHCASFTNLPWPDNHFDHGFSMEAIYYAADAIEALKEIRRILRVRGTFTMCIDFFEENALSHSWPQDVDVEMVRLSQAGWESAFEDAGFKVLNSWRCLDPTPLPDDFPPEKREAEAHFRKEIGSLAVTGRKVL